MDKTAQERIEQAIKDMNSASENLNGANRILRKGSIALFLVVGQHQDQLIRIRDKLKELLP
jgi:hypothetical protein